MTAHPSTLRALLGALALVVGLGAEAGPLEAQWVRESEQFYLPAGHNWKFRDNYANADRLFNAFDYGHAILYEELYTRPDGPVERLEEKEFDFLTRRLLLNPPRVPLEEGAIEVAYAKLAPEAKMMFHWAHLLHRQAYDVWADERLSPAEKDAAMAEVLAYYRSRPDLAFSTVPKSMEIMDGQYFSLAFRQRYPKFNGLIWAYHWLQVGLYEPLLVGGDVQERKAGVDATVGRFWQMISDAPENMPHLMPMTASVAPEFSRRYPEVAIVFDNLHMMHDVVSDVLVSEKVPRGRKRQELLRQAELFRSDTAYATTREEWLRMAEMMGANNMGGRAVGFTAALPEPTVARGASMADMDHGAHAAQPADHAAMGHATHGADAGTTAPDREKALEFAARLLSDPAVEARIHADPRLHRLRSDHARAAGDPHAGHAQAQRAPGSAGEPSDADELLALAAEVVRDGEVQRRIQQDPVLRRQWEDPGVRRVLLRRP
ncbi:MAG TPA: hypothetical protein VHG51_00545 [Longimicrobiaceae bacterium]|nr:hypothetical protein [Longimicrobiaceae bacterium]